MPKKPTQIRIKDKRGGRFIVDDVVLNGYGKALGPYGIAVYIALCRHANMQNQQCWPSQKTIADKTGMSVRQVKNMIDKCEELGLITRKIEDGKYTIYTLLEPKNKHLDRPLHGVHPCTTEHTPLHGMQDTPAHGADKGTKEGTKEGKKNIIKRKKYSSLKDISEEDLVEISIKYQVSLGFVKLKLETLANYCEAKGRKYKNYKSALRNFVLGDMQKQIERKQNDKYAPIDARNI